ncbi:hypothetical protein GCM10009664_51020 [Kitasatospora gansuensis]
MRLLLSYSVTVRDDRLSIRTQVPGKGVGDPRNMSASMQPRTTNAYYLQAVLSFALATAALAIGIVYLPVDPWMRGFLAVGLLYEITAAFTLAKVIRDRQEVGEIASRVDQARLDKLLAEHDPFRVDGI